MRKIKEKKYKEFMNAPHEVVNAQILFWNLKCQHKSILNVMLTFRKFNTDYVFDGDFFQKTKQFGFYVYCLKSYN